MTPTPLSNHQWEKVVRAAVFSFGSGAVGGFVIGITNALSSLANGGHFALSGAVIVAVVVSAVVGGLNTLAVFVEQLFKPS